VLSWPVVVIASEEPTLAEQCAEMQCAMSLRTSHLHARRHNGASGHDTRAKSMQKARRRFTQDQSGASATEYGLMVALIALLCLLAVIVIGQQVGGTYEKVHDAVRDVNE
jgi:pilus assembly protein Flp/PilA